MNIFFDELMSYFIPYRNGDREKFCVSNKSVCMLAYLLYKRTLNWLDSIFIMKHVCLLVVSSRNSPIKTAWFRLICWDIKFRKEAMLLSTCGDFFAPKCTNRSKNVIFRNSGSGTLNAWQPPSPPLLSILVTPPKLVFSTLRSNKNIYITSKKCSDLGFFLGGS